MIHPSENIWKTAGRRSVCCQACPYMVRGGLSAKQRNKGNKSTENIHQVNLLFWQMQKKEKKSELYNTYPCAFASAIQNYRNINKYFKKNIFSSRQVNKIYTGKMRICFSQLNTSTKKKTKKNPSLQSHPNPVSPYVHQHLQTLTARSVTKNRCIILCIAVNDSKTKKNLNNQI